MFCTLESATLQAMQSLALLILFSAYAFASDTECVFTKIDDGSYYIGNERSTEYYFDWYFARLACRSHWSTLVSIETSEEWAALEEFIVGQDFPEGSTFATSGHSFNTLPHMLWEGSDENVTLDRWPPEKPMDPLETSFLCLQLVNSSLHMCQSYGQDDYYICEYRPTVRQLWLSLAPNTRLNITMWSIFMALGCGLYFLFHWKTEKHPKEEKIEQNKKLLQPQYTLGPVKYNKKINIIKG